MLREKRSAKDSEEKGKDDLRGREEKKSRSEGKVWTHGKQQQSLLFFFFLHAVLDKKLVVS